MENQEKPAENPQEIVQLSPKRERFCQEYIKDHNATEAAKRTKYSEKTAYSQGQRLLKDVEIQARIAQLEKPIIDKLGIDTEWVVSRSKEIVERCMQHVPVMVFDKEEKVYKQAKDEETGEGIYQFDAKGANGALALLAKHTGGFTEHIEHSGKMTVEGIPPKVPSSSLSPEQKESIRFLIKKLNEEKCKTQSKK